MLFNFLNFVSFPVLPLLLVFTFIHLWRRYFVWYLSFKIFWALICVLTYGQCQRTPPARWRRECCLWLSAVWSPCVFLVLVFFSSSYLERRASWMFPFVSFPDLGKVCHSFGHVCLSLFSGLPCAGLRAAVPQVTFLQSVSFPFLGRDHFHCPVLDFVDSSACSNLPLNLSSGSLSYCTFSSSILGVFCIHISLSSAHCFLDSLHTF